MYFGQFQESKLSVYISTLPQQYKIQLVLQKSVIFRLKLGFLFNNILFKNI